MDTTIAVTRGQRLDVNAFGGEVTVRAWNRNDIRIEATTSGRDRVEVSSSTTAGTVRTQGRRGPPSEIQLRISVPPWVGLNVSGVNTSLKVEGVHPAITAESGEGDGNVPGVHGSGSLRPVQASLSLTSRR